MIGAFFDIDGTLYRDSLIIEHFKKLIKYEVIDFSAWESHLKEDFNKWDQRIGDYDNYLIGLANIYINAIKGLSINYNSFIADKVMELEGNRVYRFTRKRIKWHKTQGHLVIFISGSPDFLVERMAKKWGADDFMGSTYLHDNETFLGEAIPMWDSTHKKEALKNFIKKYNIDTKLSYAYGDTMGDYSMLSTVNNPFAINPSNELFSKIRKDENISKKIKIIVERKDMIYQLDPKVETVDI